MQKQQQRAQKVLKTKPVSKPHLLGLHSAPLTRSDHYNKGQIN